MELMQKLNFLFLVKAIMHDPCIYLGQDLLTSCTRAATLSCFAGDDARCPYLHLLICHSIPRWTRSIWWTRV